MGLNISAEASVGQMMATKDKKLSPDVMMLHEPQQLEKHPGKEEGSQNSRIDFKLEITKCT